MRRTSKIALVATIATVAVPMTLHYLRASGDNDPMATTLHEFGFVRVPLASKLMNVGSLYYINAGLTDFKTACHVEKAELGENDVIESPGMDIEQNFERRGQMDALVMVDFGSLVKGTAENDSKFVHKVHVSLTEVVVQELPLDRGSLISRKKMSEPGCGDVASKYLYDAPRGYVCQVQKTLKARAEYKLDRDFHDDLKANVTRPDINTKIKQAIEAHGDTDVVEREGRLFSGSALTWGVSMDPTCLTPKTAHFPRILPQNRFDWFVDYVKFKILEPFLAG